jgi:glycosyltransferase involved in cell wall biosynthesis
MRVNIFIRNPYRLGNFSVEIFYKELIDELENKIDIKLIRVPFKNKGIIPRLLNILFCAVNQVEINHIVGDISYCSFLMHKKRLVLTILDCVSLHRHKGIKKHLLKFFLFKFPILKSSKVIVISDATKNDLIHFINLKKVEYKVIPVTVSKTFFNKKIQQKNSTKKFNKNFLIIGTAPNKNIERIAVALGGVECKLSIIGKLNSRQKTELINSKINFKEIAYPLTESQIINEYKKSDLLIFCSELEGFGMPIIEANLMGINILTSNISSMPYVASDSAVYVDPFAVQSIKDGIVRIIDNGELRDQLILKGLKNSNRFLIKQIANKHLTLYKSL